MAVQQSTLDLIDKLLDKTARECLKLMAGGKLTFEQHIKLDKWMYSLMNQRTNIRERVAKRGSGELDKVLKFLSKASEVLLELKEASNS